MQLNNLALCAALLAAVEARIAFTTLPSTVKAGSPVKLGWEGSDGTPVTITLKQGEANDLKTVALITGSASGNSYTWTPSSDLPNGGNYALQIAQDDTDINYTGLFSLTGGSSSGSGKSSSTSASATASESSESSSKTTATTTAAPIGTASSGLASGTGVSSSRNTTLSRATLSSSRTSSSTGSATATTTSEEGSAATTSSTASPTGGATAVASNFGLLVAGFAAVAYLL